MSISDDTPSYLKAIALSKSALVKPDRPIELIKVLLNRNLLGDWAKPTLRDRYFQFELTNVVITSYAYPSYS
jgi:hypothetical protein